VEFALSLGEEGISASQALVCLTSCLFCSCACYIFHPNMRCALWTNCFIQMGCELCSGLWFLLVLIKNATTWNVYQCIPSTDVIQLTLTLKMTTAQVVETSVTVNNNSPIQDYVHLDDQTRPTFNCYYWRPFSLRHWRLMNATNRAHK